MDGEPWETPQHMPKYGGTAVPIKIERERCPRSQSSCLSTNIAAISAVTDLRRSRSSTSSRKRLVPNAAGNSIALLPPPHSSSKAPAGTSTTTLPKAGRRPRSRPPKRLPAMPSPPPKPSLRNRSPPRRSLRPSLPRHPAHPALLRAHRSFSLRGRALQICPAGGEARG